MNTNTSLPEVARMLPKEAADLLVDLSPPAQKLILTLVRNIIASWEGSGVVLDPITFSAVVTPVVATLLGMIMNTTQEFQ